MIITVILTLTALVAFNFVLLIFSCNKTSKVIEEPKPLNVTKPVRPSAPVKVKKPTIASTQLQRRPLAPTGS